MIRQFVFVLVCAAALILAITPASAQTPPLSNGFEWKRSMDGVENLLDELENGLAGWKERLHGWVEGAETTLWEFLGEMEPVMIELMDLVGDWSLYERPDMLPNGDVIIRRKQGEPYQSSWDGSEAVEI